MFALKIVGFMQKKWVIYVTERLVDSFGFSLMNFSLRFKWRSSWMILLKVIKDWI